MAPTYNELNPYNYNFNSTCTSTISNSTCTSTISNICTSGTINITNLTSDGITFGPTSLENNGIAKNTKEKETKKDKIQCSFYFKKIEVLVPDKVIRFTFEDGIIIKTICDDEDDFNFRFAFFIALAKKLQGKYLTPEGIIAEAKNYSYQKTYNKIVDKGIKLYLKSLKEEEQKKAKERELKEIKKRQAAKKKTKREKARNRRVNELAEAIKKANK